MQRYRAKYTATVHREVEFNAVDQEDAESIMRGYPGNERDMQMKRISHKVEHTDVVVSLAPCETNADIKDLPLLVGGHKTTVCELISVAAGFDADHAFGSEYLSQFAIEKTPSWYEFTEWLLDYANGEYYSLITPDNKQGLLSLMPRIQSEVAIGQIKAQAESMGAAVTEIEVPVKRPAVFVPDDELFVPDKDGECVICGATVEGGGLIHEDLCDDCSEA